MNDAAPLDHALCFRSLFQGGRSFSFPCDGRGQVHLDALSERVRNDYFYARAMVGRDLAPPSVEQRATHRTPVPTPKESLPWTLCPASS